MDTLSTRYAVPVDLFGTTDARYLPLLKSVERLLAAVPASYRAGLRRVVLHEASALTGREKRKKTRSRGRTFLCSRARGFYHQPWQGEPAWIELHVDNMIGGLPPGLLRWRFLANSVAARTLYHELGHHIHQMISPESADKEVVAEQWRKKLSRAYFGRKYWYLMPLAWVLRWVVRAVKACLKAREGLSARAR